MIASEVETNHRCAISLTSRQPGSVIGLGVVRPAVRKLTPRANSSVSMAQRPPRISAVNMAPLSVNNDAGTLTSVAAASKVATTSAALVVSSPRGDHNREWSNGEPHRFVGRGFLAAFAGLVYAFAEVVADEGRQHQRAAGNFCLSCPFTMAS